jgi:hypothetical protein
MTRFIQIMTLALLMAGCGRRHQPPSQEDREVYLLHEGLHRVARLSLKILQATDPGDPAVRSLRSEAQAHLIVYSKEVAELSGQHDWPLLNDPLVAEIRQYLKETESPNQPSEGTR